MPYKDPEKQKAAQRESVRRRRAVAAGERMARVVEETEAGVGRVLPDPPGRDELLRLLGVQARGGSVRAAELLLRMNPEGEDVNNADPIGDSLDDLAKARARRAS